MQIENVKCKQWNWSGQTVQLSDRTHDTHSATSTRLKWVDYFEPPIDAQLQVVTSVPVCVQMYNSFKVILRDLGAGVVTLDSSLWP